MISVVLPVLDGADHLGEAIASAEVAGAGEVVVVDGGSRDGSRRVARGFGCVRLIRQRGPGLPDAYNEGVAAAAGDRVAFIGHDDLYAPGALRALDRSLGDAAACFGRVRFELLDGSPPPGFRLELLGSDRDALLLETMLARRETLEQIGQLRYDAGHDVDWIARLRESALPVARVPTLVARKRMRFGSAGHTAAAQDPANLVRVLRESVRRQGVGG